MFQKFSAFVRWTLVVIGIYVVFQILSGVYAVVSGGSFTDFVWLFANDLATDRAGRTNFLLLGIGGENHDGGDLTDTFLVVSYHSVDGTLALLSVPRDFWSAASDGIGMRVNRIYEYEKWRLKDSPAALESVAETASQIVDLPIHYYMKINFTGFVDLVDALGGVKVLVENAIEDPYYPCPDLLNYCPFSISAGVQTLDGETALQFARSRKTTSDFDRGLRQQKILEAVREKALALDLLTSPRKLKSFYNIFSEHTETNLRFRELIQLGKIAENFNKQNIVQIVLSDEPNFVGGLLYAPNREDYNGAAVLLPNGDDFRQIHMLTSVLFDHPRVVVDALTIEVLNASGRPRIANDAAYYLNRFGLNTARINNYPAGVIPHSQIYFYDEAVAEETVAVLADFIGLSPTEGPLDLRRRGFDITLVLGEDWVDL